MLALAVVLASLVGVALGLLGGGGSILTLPILHYVLGLEGRTSIAMSLLVVGTTSIAAVISHARAGRVQWAIGAVFGAASMAGAFAAGKWVAPLLPETVLLMLFAGMMVVTAIAMLRKAKAPPAQTDASVHATPVAPQQARRRWVGIAVEGIVVGAVTGLVGAGGGFLVVPALVLLGGLRMDHAVGTSLLVIAMKSAAGFAGYASHVSIDLPITFAITAAAIAGSFVGAAISGKLAPERLRAGFAWFVVAMATFVLVQELPKQWALQVHVLWAVLASAVTTTAAVLVVRQRERARERVRAQRARDDQAGGSPLVVS